MSLLSNDHLRHNHQAQTSMSALILDNLPFKAEPNLTKLLLNFQPPTILGVDALSAIAVSNIAVYFS